MNIKKLQTKLASLQTVYKIVESQKNITLINILKLTKQNSFYYLRSQQSKQLVDGLVKQYGISHPLIQPLTLLSFKKFIKPKVIWVYVTEKEQFSTNSYLRHETNLLANFDIDNHYIIPIGERAINFAQKNDWRILISAPYNDVESLSKSLPTFLEDFLTVHGYHNINFVINSNKIKQTYLTIVPIKDLNIKWYQNQDIILDNQLDFSKLKIYPEINEFIDSELHSYLTYMMLTLLSESSLISEKYKLVGQNKTLNELEEKNRKLARQILRLKRELEVEQISILSKRKDLLHEVKQKGRLNA